MKLLKFSTRNQIRRLFGHTEPYAFVKAVSESILKDPQAFPSLRCPTDEMFYEAFCIVDKLMFSKTDIPWHDAFVQGAGDYEKNLVDEDRDGDATQEERHRLVFLILLNAGFIINTLPISCSTKQYSLGLMNLWRQYVTPDFSRLCFETMMRNAVLAVSMQQFMASYEKQADCFSMQIDKLMREAHDDEYLHGYQPSPEDYATGLLEDKNSVDGWQQKSLNERILQAISIMKDEKCPEQKQNFFDDNKRKYHYLYIYKLMSEQSISEKYGLPHFEKESDFLKYIGNPCTLKVLARRRLLIKGTFPNWTMPDKSQTDLEEAIHVAQRFLNIFTRGVPSY